MQLTELDNTFQLAADFINKSNQSVFLTGKAGTGKTTFLKYIKENTLKNAAIVAPTGVAAMNAGGTTIHSFFQLPFTPFIPGTKAHFSKSDANDKHNLVSQLRLNAERKDILQQLDLLIIDEISMVRADLLDAIDTVLRYVRNQPSTPFGGVQVLYIGDMYQLPPVIKPDEWQLLSSTYSGPFFFCSQVIAEQPPVYIELTTVYRQRDEDFIKLLNQVRNNEMDPGGYKLLHSRYQPGFIPDQQDRVITLTTHNAKADSINAQALAAIGEKAWQFSATIEGSFFENAFPADEVLQVKLGAQVMFIKNDMEKVKRYYNGKIGIIDKIEDDRIWVACSVGTSIQLIELKKETWLNIKYTLNKKTGHVEEEEIGSFTQYPLRLAWAITIHKSQGLTFEKAVIDAGQAFAPGQVYVALSRCTSLPGLHLLSRISYNSLQSDPRIVAFAKNQQSLSEQSELLNKASLHYKFEVIRSIFDFNGMDTQFSDYKSWVYDPQHFKDSLTSWLNEIQGQWIKVIVPGRRFGDQLAEITNRMDDPGHLQQRVIAASGYFLNELNVLATIIQRCPAITDNRQLARDHDDKLQHIYDMACMKIHFIEGCKRGYSLEKHQGRRSSFIKRALSQNSYSGKSSFVPRDIPHPELYNLLKRKRDDLCDSMNLPVYMVCSSSSIEQMTSALPTSLHALGNISGFGKVKLKQFGKQFVDIISAYCEERGVESDQELLPQKKVKKPKADLKPDTKSVSFHLYQSGKKVSEIAEERSLTVTTIEGHLAHYVSEGKIDLLSLVDANKIGTIKKVRLSSGSDSITTLKGLLPEISYGELRLFLAAEKSGTPSG